MNIETQVLIVGGGPVGLTTSILLSQLGVRSMLVERHSGTAHAPRAHVINRRSMEIFRSMGLADSILLRSTPPERMGNVVWVNTLAGAEIGRYLAWGCDPERTDIISTYSPARVVNFPQIRLDPFLRETAESYNTTDVRFSHELVTFKQTPHGVFATIRNQSLEREFTVQAKYLVAADGANSKIRQQLGIPLHGKESFRNAVSIYFTADLRPWIDDRPGILYYILHPEAGGVFIGANVGTEMPLRNPFYNYKRRSARFLAYSLEYTLCLPLKRYKTRINKSSLSS